MGAPENQATLYHLGNSYIKWFFSTASSLSAYLFSNNEYLIFSNFLIKHFRIILRQNQTQLHIVHTLGLNYVKLSNFLTGPYVLFSSETWA